ncbi:MAG: alpha/beta fold hydrolase [Anaerolineae bacterium]
MSKFRFPSWLLAGGAAFGAWVLYQSFSVDHDMPIGPAIDATRHDFHGQSSTLMSYYADTSVSGRPLVLLHSINAAANAYEVRPIFEQYRGQRPVYALDLPGFGFSERTNREYSIDLYVAAITDFMLDIVGEPADVLSISLTSEFMAKAAHQTPELFHSLTMISPTGFTPRESKPISQSASEKQQSNGVYQFLTNPLWSQPLFDLLVMKSGIRYFLGKNFADEPDEGLIDYHHRSSHQPNARFAPFYFVSGALFAPNILDAVYQHLNLPVLVLYDTDPNISFDLLPSLLATRSNWRARRIPNTRGLPHFDQAEITYTALDEFWADIE